MSNTISLTLPRNDEEALVAGATLLLTLAGKVPAMELPDMRDPCVGCGDNPELPDGFVRDAKAALLETPEPYPSPVEPDPTIAPPLLDKIEDNYSPPPPLNGRVASDLDADGLPWDARIHSSSKNKIADGTWRKKRGVDKEDYDRVVDELRQLMAVPVATRDDELPGMWSHSDFEGGATDADVPPPPPVVADDDTPAAFTAFLKAVSHKIQAKELTMADVTAALPEGVANLQLLNGRQDLIPQVWAKLTGGAGDE